VRLPRLALVLTLVAWSAAACVEPVDPCQVNPTRQAADGRWVEADGEELDDDPCDSDDFDGREKKSTKRPTRKTTPRR